MSIPVSGGENKRHPNAAFREFWRDCRMPPELRRHEGFAKFFFFAGIAWSCGRIIASAEQQGEYVQKFMDEGMTPNA